ncbi:MAG: sigma-54-dependent Fis family transcriptional regulator [Proteobacteria bacterium]|nr:sigma-54-dependent Fis family transcriptional regulator [Pseudomonadota bacterium]
MRLLIVGDLGGQLGAASQMAIKAGASVTHVPEAENGLEVLRSKGADLLMLEVTLDIKGMIEQIRSEHIAVPVIACGIGNNADLAVAAIKAGAREYLPLPPDADLIAAVLRAVSEDSKPFIYHDSAMDRVVKLADQVSPSEASILITGESGTGKEIMARYVHENSNRRNKQFICVNCAAIPENLLESELFGHEKGAFTGAIARRVGKFEEADGGTLLLDEISEMDTRLQAKLLRALQEREIDRVGGSKPVKINIRVIATSNRDLVEAVASGDFREDLLFRLNVVNLKIPPLRERREDIRALADHFAILYAEINDVEFRPISEVAGKMLLNYGWQGNVRELENTIHRAVLLAQGPEIGPDAILLPDGTAPAPDHGSAGIAEGRTENGEDSSLVGKTVAEVERVLIIDTLRHCLGNRTHTANILGISIRTLRNKLNQYQADGTQVPSPRDSQSAAV